MNASIHLSNVSPLIFKNASATVIPPIITTGGSHISIKYFFASVTYIA